MNEREQPWTPGPDHTDLDFTLVNPEGDRHIGMSLDEGRIYLACPECRVESPGWTLDLKAPRHRFAGGPDRFARYSWIMGRG